MAWTDWLYETDPLYTYPELQGDLSVPRRNRIAWTPAGPLPVTDGGAVAQTFEDRVDISGGQSDRPQEIGRERTARRTKLGAALMDFLPRALEAGAAGASLPPSGSGATDFFRAMQAGRHALDVRDANRLAMQQQQQQIAMNEDYRRAQQEQATAHADLYRAQAEAALRPKPGFAEKYQEALRITNDPAQAAIIASGGALQHMKPPEPHKGLVRVDPATGQKLGVVPNEQDEYWAPEGAVRMPPAPRNPPTPRTTYIPGAGGKVTAVTPDGKGGFAQVPLGPIGKPEKPAAGAKPPKPPGPAQILQVRNRRTDALAKAEKDYQKALETAKKDADGSDLDMGDPDDAAIIMAQQRKAETEYAIKKARIEKEYEENLRILHSAPPAAAPAVKRLTAWESKGIGVR